ncbi:MAG: phosphomevalonate kinase [Lactobacillaceae bacterium]|jgi:phosphomevalonate kinase|nr:phosphomevalonate kinase [Lactobacillaceae bacterium]
MIKVEIPGKLFIAGEYAVTTPGQPALIFAVNRFVTATITTNLNANIKLTSDLLGTMELPTATLANHVLIDEWAVVLRGIQLVQQYLYETGQPLQSFDLTLTSNLPQANHKLGLGSSGAVLVATLKAVLQLHHLNLSNLELFKLAALALLTTPNFKRGSMGDVAVAIYTGLISYTKFETPAVMTMLEQKLTLHAIITTAWPRLTINQLTWPVDWQILIGWTQTPASTQTLLKHSAPIAPALTKLFLTESLVAFDHLELALQTHDFALWHQAITMNRLLLDEYTTQAKIPYSTPQLTNLITAATALDLPAKISGAGAGDNGLAFTDDATKITALYTAWRAQNIIPLDLQIYQAETGDRSWN